VFSFGLLNGVKPFHVYGHPGPVWGKFKPAKKEYQNLNPKKAIKMPTADWPPAQAFLRLSTIPVKNNPGVMSVLFTGCKTKHAEPLIHKLHTGDHTFGIEETP
jgi:hypothetical protein